MTLTSNPVVSPSRVGAIAAIAGVDDAAARWDDRHHRYAPVASDAALIPAETK